MKTARGLRKSPSVVCLLYRKRAGKTIWQVAQSNVAGYNRFRNIKLSGVKAEVTLIWQRKEEVTAVNGIGGAIFFFLILYIVIRFGVKHGIQDAKKDEERKN